VSEKYEENRVKNDKKTRYIVADGLLIDLIEERAILKGVALTLSPKPYALLNILMRQPQAVVSKDTLFEEVWNGMAVSDAVLTTAMKELRQALNDAARNPAWIETVHGRGYRFLKPTKYSKKPKYDEIVQAATADSAAEARAIVEEDPVLETRFGIVTKRDLMFAAPGLVLSVILALVLLTR
jgi:DNA-binding winged helix-turn-helix (wHTH) protein